MNYPADLKYTQDHEWCRVSGARAHVGITDHAQDALGDIVYVELPAVGAVLERGKTFGVVESTKAVSDLYAPVSGKVVAVNSPLVEAPEAINDDPYEEGWMIEVELSDPSELAGLLDQPAYVKHVESAGA